MTQDKASQRESKAELSLGVGRYSQLCFPRKALGKDLWAQPRVPLRKTILCRTITSSTRQVRSPSLHTSRSVCCSLAAPQALGSLLSTIFLSMNFNYTWADP